MTRGEIDGNEENGRSEEDENEAIVRRFIEEVWNQGNLDTIDELFTDDSSLHDPTGEQRGPEAFKAYDRRYLTAFPDVKYEIEDLIAEGDKVAFRSRVRGTHEGPLIGIEPTGRRVDVTGIVVARIENGKIAERWANFDVLGMLRQLGVVPEQPAAPRNSE